MGNQLEKIGCQLFDSFGNLSSEIGDNSRVITASEKQNIRRVSRSAVLLCVVAGAISAAIAAIAAVYAEQWYGSESTTPSAKNYWLLFGSITLIAALLEIIYIYYITLKAVHNIAKLCDVKIRKTSDSSLILSLVRAALEIPQPKNTDQYIDPHRGASKWKLIGISLLYKSKVMASNMLAKILVRKLLVRGGTRAWLEFLAIPITAIWNAIVCHWIIREATIRALGPSLIEEKLPSLLTEPTAFETAQRALACCISTTKNIHPNHVSLLQWLRKNTETTVTDEPESLTIFNQQLEQLNANAQHQVIRILAISIIIDGKIAKSENDLFKNVSHKTQNLINLRSLKHAFISGNDISIDHLS